MNSGEFRIVTLADGTNWFVTSEVEYQDGRYQYMVAMSKDGEEFFEKTQVMRVYLYEGNEYFDLVEDSELLKVVVPLLVPESKEYMDILAD